MQLQGCIQGGFTNGQTVWEIQIQHSYAKHKTKNIKVILNELSPNTISNTIDKYIIITFSIVNNPWPYHSYMFITENCSSSVTTIMYFRTTSLPQNPLLKTVFLKKSLDTSMNSNQKNLQQGPRCCCMNFAKFCKMPILQSTYSKNF